MQMVTSDLKKNINELRGSGEPYSPLCILKLPLNFHSSGP